MLDPWTAPHNLYLALLHAGGVPALVLFLGIFALGLRAGLTGILGGDGWRARALFSIGLVWLLLSWPIMGLTESLISTYIAKFLIWIGWSLAAVEYARIFTAGRPVIPRPSGRVVAVVLLPVAVLLLWGGMGNILVFRAYLPLAALQGQIRGIPVIQPEAASAVRNATDAGLTARIENAGDEARLATRMLPYDWRPVQMSGEYEVLAAFQEQSPGASAAALEVAMDRYRRGIELHPDLPLLRLRLAEIIEYRLEYPVADEARSNQLREEMHANRARGEALDPFGSYRRYW